jgi:DNA-binding LytR/AlgR family response regulator
MTGINGLDTAHKLRASGFTADIIINAIDDTHVHEGYDVEAMHYFIKGKTSEEKLEEVFLKAVERCQRRKKDIMTFGRRGEQINVPIDNILYFEVQGQIVTVHYYKGSSVETFKFYSTLQNICKPLVGKGFWKNHKSYVISKKYIYKMTAGQVEMENGDVLPIGREYKKNAGCDI